VSTDPFTRALLTALDYEILAALEGESVFLAYGPRGKPKQTFEGTIKKEGIEVDGNLYSPSYAAVNWFKQAGCGTVSNDCKRQPHN
jgi:hypothetical protein